MKLRQLTLALSFVGASTVGLVGCGGSSNDYPELVTLDGAVINGYLSNAYVCVDINRNRVCDQGEPNDMTDGAGNFSILTSDVSSPLIMDPDQSASLVDVTTLSPVSDLFLTGPNNSRTLTPLTTLTQVKSEMEGTSFSQAQSVVLDELGLAGSGVDLTNFDHIALQNSSDATTVTRATKMSQVASIVSRLISSNRQAIETSGSAANTVTNRNILSVYNNINPALATTPLKAASDAVQNAIDTSTPLTNNDISTLVTNQTIDPATIEDALETIDTVVEENSTVDDEGGVSGGTGSGGGSL